MKLPGSFAPLFRNYVFDTIDAEKHGNFIIKTTLAQGTWQQITWLFEFYGFEKVRAVFMEDYFGLATLPESTRKLWELLFVENPEQLRKDPDAAAKWRCRRMANI